MLEKKGKRWDKVDNAILTVHAKHHTASEIAEKLGRTPESVKYQARKLGLTLKRGYNLSVPKHNAWSEEELEYLHKHAGVKTSLEIAEELNRSRLAVKVMATRQGLSLQKNPWSEEQIEKLFDLHSQGFSYKKIAKKIKRSEESVRAKITYLMLPTNYVWTEEDIETLMLMKSEGKEAREIAKKLGRTKHSVRRKYWRLKGAEN